MIFAGASGFDSYTVSIYVDPIEITRHDIYLTPQNIPGDLNMDGTINLRVAILAGYILTNMDSSRQVWILSDISGDGKIGTEEMVYILNDICKSD